MDLLVYIKGKENATITMRYIVNLVIKKCHLRQFVSCVELFFQGH